MKFILLASTALFLLFQVLTVVGFALQPMLTHRSRHHRQASSEPKASDSQAKPFHFHSSLIRQRKSVSYVQTQGIFGLGGLEIAVILVAAAFIVGPEKIGSMIGQMKSGLDDVPDELKKIPEEFQKGVEEGEMNARARNAKVMKRPPATDE